MEVLNEKRLSISRWAEEDRPREKLLLKGRHALTDSELIAILIGSGNKKESAVDLSKRILETSQNDLSILGKLEIHDLMQFNGIGEAKAISIIAALELGRRRKETERKDLIKITSSKTAYSNFIAHFEDLNHEEFWILYLNRANKIISTEKLSMGSLTGTVVEIKSIFKKGIEKLASGIIIAHNHPSGNLQPSQQDIDLTKKIKETGKLMDITLLDHLIVTDTHYFSFADEGIL
jgi:DNA repair protein RadC